VTVQGVRATEIGAFTLTGPDGKGGTGTVRGKYLLLWQRQVDGSWLLHRDIWNYDSAG
jgi:ketosteroid isomerase-like protein